MLSKNTLLNFVNGGGFHLINFFLRTVGIEKGATSFFEDYDFTVTNESGEITCISSEKKDIHKDYGAYCYKGLRHSLCHGWASGAVPFLTEYVLGIKIIEPGCKKIEIRPNLGNLKFVKASFPTPYGMVLIEHRKSVDEKIVTIVNAPDEIEVVRSQRAEED